jgi:hypothetical protein
MVAIVGAGIGQAGLLLIFAGFLFAQSAVLPSDTSDAYIAAFKRRGYFGLIPFTAALTAGVVALGYWWLPSTGYAHGVIAAFAITVLATAVYGVWAIRLL